MTDFERFQKTFKEYQKKFGLTGYSCYFKHEPLKDSFANITPNCLDKVAIVRLNSCLDEASKPHKDVRRSAKHEAIHLLLNKVESCATRRCVTEFELNESIEELAVKLEELIP